MDEVLFPNGKPQGVANIDMAFEQYKLAVEMWDRVRARRQSNNAFYVTVNSALFTLVALEKSSLKFNPFVLVGGFAICALWFVSISFYKKLTNDKFFVISRMESVLPSSPFSAENIRLKDGAVNLVRRPFTSVERTIAVLFMFLYIIMLFVAISNASSSGDYRCFLPYVKCD